MKLLLNFKLLTETSIITSGKYLQFMQTNKKNIYFLKQKLIKYWKRNIFFNETQKKNSVIFTSEVQMSWLNTHKKKKSKKLKFLKLKKKKIKKKSLKHCKYKHKFTDLICIRKRSKY